MRALLRSLICLAFALPVRAIDVTLARCDELLAQQQADPWEVTRDASALAWGESATLYALLDFYEASGDRKYLDEVARRGDRELSHRDDVRGVADCSGKIHPAWSMGYKYTVAAGALVDAEGKKVLELRSTPRAFNHLTKVEVSQTDGGFSLHITNSQFKRQETLAGLSLDPKSERYVERIVNNDHPSLSPKEANAQAPSDLIAIKVLPGSTTTPVTQTITLEPLTVSFCGYVGIIYHPLLRFSQVVKQDPNLADLLPAADRFVRAAEESYADVEPLWRAGPGPDEGSYLSCKRGEAFVYDNLPLPFNFQSKHACAQLLLADLTGKLSYRERAAEISRKFKNRLKLVNQDQYVWNYWFEPMTTTGYTRADNISANVSDYKPANVIEDVSHATLNIEIVYLAHAHGVVFDDVDMQRFANTFLRSVARADRKGLTGRVDGTNSAYYTNTTVASWLLLSETDPRVYDVAREVYLTRGREELLGAAAILKWQQKLSARN